MEEHRQTDDPGSCRWPPPPSPGPPRSRTVSRHRRLRPAVPPSLPPRFHVEHPWPLKRQERAPCARGLQPVPPARGPGPLRSWTASRHRAPSSLSRRSRPPPAPDVPSPRPAAAGPALRGQPHRPRFHVERPRGLKKQRSQRTGPATPAQASLATGGRPGARPSTHRRGLVPQAQPTSPGTPAPGRHPAPRHSAAVPSPPFHPPAVCPWTFLRTGPVAAVSTLRGPPQRPRFHVEPPRPLKKQRKPWRPARHPRGGLPGGRKHGQGARPPTSGRGC